MYSIQINGMRFSLREDNSVYWSDSWENIWKLSEQGYFTRKNFGANTYGHTEFYYTGKTEAK